MDIHPVQRSHGVHADCVLEKIQLLQRCVALVAQDPHQSSGSFIADGVAAEIQLLQHIVESQGVS